MLFLWDKNEEEFMLGVIDNTHGSKNADINIWWVWILC